MLTVLVGNSLRLSQESLMEQARQRVAELGILFNAALGAPLVERDYTTLQDILEETRRDKGLTYLVLLDRDGHVVARAGWPVGTPLPEPNPSLDLNAAANGRFELVVTIRLAGREYGRLAYGLSTSFLLESRRHLMQQSLLIAAAEVMLSILLLFGLGMWLTRHLGKLTRASLAIAEGRLDTIVPIESKDEVGLLASSFNRMSGALRERMEAQHATEAELRQALSSLSHSEAEQRRYAKEVELERARLASLLSAMNLGILFVDTDARVSYHNPTFTRIWRIEEATTLVGRPVTEVLASASGTLLRPDHFSRHIQGTLASREVYASLEIPMADGRVVTQLNYPVMDRDGHFIGQLWIYEDVTHERQTAAQLAYLAERDALTGLYNRRHFERELARMISECDRHHHQGGLLLFDLDEFKVINDNFGHRAGDALLIRVAGEVGTLVRRYEVLCRLGGDEFALLLPNTTEDEASQLAERIVRAVGTIPFRFEGQNLRLTSSVGIAFYPRHAADAETLVAHADAAMYQAKRAGKNTWRVYRADLDTARSLISHLTWNERIDHALEKGLFRLHFQGVYRARDGTLSHLEALVRMVDEERPDTLIRPGRFIPVAEKSGKIRNLDRWVLAESIRLLREKPGMPPLRSTFPVARSTTPVCLDTSSTCSGKAG